MEIKPVCFYSNRLEELFIYFKNIVFSNDTSFFSNRIVVVPSLALRDWLQQALATHPDLQICFGIKFVLLSELFHNLPALLKQKELGQDRAYFPSIPHLALRLEKEILDIFLEEKPSKGFNEELFKPLFSYLKIEFNKDISLKSRRRLSTLCDSLAYLFSIYGHFGGELIQKWEKDPSDWQEVLWQKIFSSDNSWECDCSWLRSLKEKNFKPPKDTHIHVFGLSFLSSLQQELFNFLSPLLPIYFYALSPCQVFWGDVRSSKERKRLHSFLKQGDVQDFDENFSQTNSLLSAWGKLGRKFLEQIQDDTQDYVQAYYLPKKILDFPQYQELVDSDVLLEETKGPLSLLQGLQSDLLLLRPSTTQSLVKIEEDCSSITIHENFSKKREVETLFHHLSSLFSSREDLAPQEIIVMAPDITEYEAYIKQIFGKENTSIPFHMMDLREENQNPFLEGFWRLIRLSFSRWEVSKVMHIFEHPIFRDAQGICEETLLFLHQVVRDTRIRWAKDVEHRHEVLKQRTFEQDSLPDARWATWDFGFDQVVLGTSMLLPKGEGASLKRLDVFPYAYIEHSQGDILEKLKFLMDSMRADLTPLRNTEQASVDDWIDYLICLYKSYFSIPMLRGKQQQLYEDVIIKLERLRPECSSLKGLKFGFPSIFAQLEKLLTNRTANFQIHNLHSVRFCSLQPMRAIPAKVIALLGMNEGVFPRVDQHYSLNHLHGAQEADYFPSKLDLDRYLFLEAMMSARESIYISYEKLPHERQRYGASVIVQELIDYLDQSFLLGEKKFSETCLHMHAPFGFHHSLFKEGEVQNYMQSDWQRACAYYGKEKVSLFRFIPEVSEPNLEKINLDNEEEYNLLIRECLWAIEDPLRLYLEKIMKISLFRQAFETFEDEEVFILKKRTQEGIVKRSIKGKGLEASWEEEKQQGGLPLGFFQEVAKKQLGRNVKEKEENLALHGLNFDQSCSIEFSSLYQECYQKSDHEWIVPAIEIVEGFSMTGDLQFVFPQGFFLFDQSSWISKLSRWVQSVVFSYLIQKYELPFEGSILTEKGKVLSPVESPKEILEDYFKFVIICLQHPCPLNADLIMCGLKNDLPRWKEVLRKRFENYSFQSPYFRWVIRQDDSLDAEKLFSFWQPLIQNAFAKSGL
jgi:exodeoxyribonuclease V gamma subunit